jgi:DNA-binding MarR family transcriptional regulator
VGKDKGREPPGGAADRRASGASSAGRLPAGTAFLLAQLGAHAAGRFAERLAPLGLVPAHAGVLRLIAREPELNQRALSARLRALPSRVVALIDELEALDMVVRRRHPSDRRSHVLTLTGKGADMLAELRGVAEAHEAELLDALDGSERAALAALLQRLADVHSLEPGIHPGYRADGRA